MVHLSECTIHSKTQMYSSLHLINNNEVSHITVQFTDSYAIPGFNAAS